MILKSFSFTPAVILYIFSCASFVFFGGLEVNSGFVFMIGIVFGFLIARQYYSDASL